MESIPFLLDDLTKKILEELEELGFMPGSLLQYKRAYERFKQFAAAIGIDSFAEDLVGKFVDHVKEKYETGQIGRARRNHLRRTALLMREYAAVGAIEWRCFTFREQPGPTSEALLALLSSFIESLRLDGRSENTIQSRKNCVRQFLLFLEDNGCNSLSMATSSMVSSFFPHLLATYRPTSIRTVASNIRSFLRFAGNEERLLHAVPLHCVRNKPIIPILSEQENSALRNSLDSGNVPLRDKAIILLALRTGVRAVDIVRMKLEDIDWINDAISILQAKTKKAFKIPLTADVGNAISAYILNDRPETDNRHVFLCSLAPFRPLADHSACYALVQRAFKQAGIRLGAERKGIHLIRHSVASRMLSKGVAVPTISSMLGHANKSSTDVYLSTDQKRLRECALDLFEIPLNCGGLR